MKPLIHLLLSLILAVPGVLLTIEGWPALSAGDSSWAPVGIIFLGFAFIGSIFSGERVRQGFRAVGLVQVKDLESVTILLSFYDMQHITASAAKEAKLASGAYCDCCCPTDLSEETWVVADAIRADHGYEVDESQVRTKTGHRSIAWIEAFRTTAFIAVIINQVSVGILFRLMDLFRLYTITDETDERVVLLNEEIKEAENDIVSLASSFLMVQVFRYGFTGHMPNSEGHQEPYIPVGSTALFLPLGRERRRMTLACIRNGGRELQLIERCLPRLFIVGCISLVVSVLMSCIPELPALGQWLLEKFQNIMGMIFAWCTLWSVGGFVRETEAFEKILHTELYPNERHLVSALVLSICSLMVIRLLDFIQDMGASSPRILQSMINVFSVLIGRPCAFVMQSDGYCISMFDLK
eukprot:g10309.t1